MKPKENNMGIFEKLIKPSTRAMLREARHMKSFSLFDLLHGYFYMRWPFFYIAMGKGDHPWAKRLAPLLGWIGKRIADSAGPVGEDGRKTSMADTYHGKVVPLEAAMQLVSVKEDLQFENLEQIVPFTRARDIILKNPDHIVALDCPCRVAKPNPCLPLDVCLIVGEPFASFAMEHQSKRARWITSEEAQRVLKEEDERGHVHHAFFKDAVLGRFYAICNCCSCCCGAMKAQRHGEPMLITSGYICQVDQNLCAACGSCIDLCQFDAIQVDGYAEVDQAVCMGCGVCVNNCPQGALSLQRDAARSAPLEIFRLMEEAGR
jgi:ferredoxin